MSFGLGRHQPAAPQLQLLLRFGFFFFAAGTVDALRTATPRPTNARPETARGLQRCTAACLLSVLCTACVPLYVLSDCALFSAVKCCVLGAWD